MSNLAWYLGLLAISFISKKFKTFGPIQNNTLYRGGGGNVELFELLVSTWRQKIFLKKSAFFELFELLGTFFMRNLGIKVQILNFLCQSREGKNF